MRKPLRATPASGSRDREFVQGLERGLGVLKAFSAETPRLTVTGVAAQAGLTRAVARRYLLTLNRWVTSRRTATAADTSR